MKRTLPLLCLFAVGCFGDDPEPLRPVTGKEEAGQVALGCLEQMASCDDWTPIKAEKILKPRPPEECKEYGDYDCKGRNEEVRLYNRSLRNAPSFRSPCQQKVDSCVDLVRALVGAPAEVVHHHH